MNKEYVTLEGKVGEFRKFSFSEDDYIVKEVIDDPQFTLDWIWDTGVCPHCKKRLDKTVQHDFYRIEVLVKENKDKGNNKKEDLLILGDTLDKRKMLIPIDQYDRVLRKSKLYKSLVEAK
jgi:hypothetical protein